MAQVTMNGIEYKDLLMKEAQLQELINYICSHHKFSFPEGSHGTWSCGQWKEPKQMPEWLEDMLITSMISQLIMMPKDEFRRVVETNCRYYNVKERTMSCEKWGGQIDLVEYSPAFKKEWDLMQEEIDAEQEEHNDEV